MSCSTSGASVASTPSAFVAGLADVGQPFGQCRVPIHSPWFVPASQVPLRCLNGEYLFAVQRRIGIRNAGIGRHEHPSRPTVLDKRASRFPVKVVEGTRGHDRHPDLLPGGGPGTQDQFVSDSLSTVFAVHHDVYQPTVKHKIRHGARHPDHASTMTRYDHQVGMCEHPGKLLPVKTRAVVNITRGDPQDADLIGFGLVLESVGDHRIAHNRTRQS